MEIETVKIYKIEQFHRITDYKKMIELAENMKTRGWNGRPLIVVDCGGEYSALTGSHRLQAAGIAGLDEIPVAIVDHGTLFEDNDITVSDMKSPDYIYSLLSEYDPEAAELFLEDTDFVFFD